MATTSETTALYVLGGIGLGAFALWYYFQKKLQPVGGIKGATDAASGVSQIAAGVQQLAAPFKSLWADFFSTQGAGSSVNPGDPKNSGSPPFFPQDNGAGVPSWLMTTNSAVNTANAAVPLLSDIFKATR